MSNLRGITIWKRWDPQKKEYVHNHIEFGFAGTRSFPRPESDQQWASWPKGTWTRRRAYLNENNEVVRG